MAEERQTNTALVYLYRDAANYKEWGRVVFEGPIDDELRRRVTSALMSSENFVAEAVRVPQLFPYLECDEDFDERYDHGWHEFHDFEETDEPVDDEASRSICAFVAEVEEAAAGGWKVSEPQEIISGIQM
jgi:hypothetical protein